MCPPLGNNGIGQGPWISDCDNLTRCLISHGMGVGLRTRCRDAYIHRPVISRPRLVLATKTRACSPSSSQTGGCWYCCNGLPRNVGWHCLVSSPQSLSEPPGSVWSRQGLSLAPGRHTSILTGWSSIRIWLLKVSIGRPLALDGASC